MRSMPCVGSWFTLTENASMPASGEVIGFGAARRPLSSTSVLAEPMPRRFTLALSPREFAPPAVDSLSGTFVTCGSAVRSSTGVSALRTSMRSLLNTVTGRTFSKSIRLMFEPVTVKASSFTVSSVSFFGSGLAVAGAVWASAVASAHSSRAVNHSTDFAVVLGVFIFVGGLMNLTQ